LNQGRFAISLRARPSFHCAPGRHFIARPAAISLRARPPFHCAPGRHFIARIIARPAAISLRESLRA
jgi:hypothetical protein